MSKLDSRAVDQLIDALKDIDSDVRESAALSLGRLNSKKVAVT